MKHWKLVLIAAALASGLFFIEQTKKARVSQASGSLPADAVGPVALLGVVDGDTLRVRLDGAEEKLRLLRIDTPERDEQGYREATRALRELLRGRELHVVFENPGEAIRDRHGRVLAYLYGDAVNLNVEMVRTGWSDFDTRFGEGRFEAAFREALRDAAQEAERNPESGDVQ